jgi:dienelactone hydrolase
MMRRVLITMTTLLLAIGSFASAAIRTETVEYKHGDTTLKGFLAYDDATTDKRPAVIIVHEWWGLNDYVKRRAQDVARLGYVAFAPDMYGDGKTTSDPKEAGKLAGGIKGDPTLEIARAQAAMDVVKNQPLVDGSRVAAMGYCFGGSVALDMARAGWPLAGVVSFHGALGTSKPAQPGAIKAKVLVLHGADDPMVKPEEVMAFLKEMKDAKADWYLTAYASAVHAFTNPEADKFGIPGVSYNANADRRSWEAMRDFFNEIFRGAADGAR